MVMTKQFHSIGGIIIGETSTGSPRVDYLTDALGSVTATVNQSAQVVNTYRYKPFGATLAKTGTGPDPAFGWAGTHGYRPTGNPFSNFYVMLRHYDELGGRWPTVDPTGFGGAEWNLYRYVENNPVTWVDPTGFQRAKNHRKAHGPQPGLPTRLVQCLSRSSQANLLDKMSGRDCNSAITKACGMSGKSALNNRSIVPKWEFPRECAPGDPDRVSKCSMKFDPGAGEGDPCTPKGICLNNEFCGDANAEEAACLVLWELGNACGCKHGYETGEQTAQNIVDACGCGNVVGPGGTSGHVLLVATLRTNV